MIMVSEELFACPSYVSLYILQENMDTSQTEHDTTIHELTDSHLEEIDKLNQIYQQELEVYTNNTCNSMFKQLMIYIKDLCLNLCPFKVRSSVCLSDLWCNVSLHMLYTSSRYLVYGYPGGIYNCYFLDEQDIGYLDLFPRSHTFVMYIISGTCLL